jgi:glutathione synthase
LRLDDKHDLIHSDYPYPIGLVYFRAGYSPDNYPSRKEWDARLRMEQSNAIKCPWIGLQLANTKKVQQVLAKNGKVERFLDNQDDIQAVYATFAGLWGLESEDEETEAVVKVGFLEDAFFIRICVVSRKKYRNKLLILR